MYKGYVSFSCLLGCDAMFVSVLSKLARARIFFSVLCLHDELTIVLKKLTLDFIWRRLEGDNPRH